MSTGVAVAILGVVLVGSYLLMWRGWRSRARRHASLPDLPGPLAVAEPVFGPVDGSYLGTTTAGDWLDRVVARGLGRRGDVAVTVTEAGVTLRRSTEPDLVIPAPALRAVRIDRAAAGRAVRRPEYLIITWAHGDHELDTALRPHHQGDLTRLQPAIAALGAHRAPEPDL
ncbi:hypothetical protein [Phytoactinopolyspora limicola]|uniref:PH-like domain-containing protein n=1 Tax=Phytoactinopolyspora limicola TaxID=2715536 RepID=UPI00140DB43E|nr:hypothetical protein [Phytoactinopolyspora limicola]